jgi:hypothetical protein
VPSYFELGQIEKIIITANNERLDMGQVPQRAAELPIEQYATLQGIQWPLHLGQARGLPLAPPNGKAQALCEALVWRSAQANTKPNPIKATEIQVATRWSRSASSAPPNADALSGSSRVANLIEVKRCMWKGKYRAMNLRRNRMRKADQSDFITRTGPATPVGRLFRSY